MSGEWEIVDGAAALVVTPRPNRLVDGVDGWRIATRHHRRPLLIPAAGEPDILDRYWIAQLARDVLQADAIRRNTALQKALRSKRAHR